MSVATNHFFISSLPWQSIWLAGEAAETNRAVLRNSTTKKGVTGYLEDVLRRLAYSAST